MSGLPLSGKVAMIGGSSRGIGLAVAHRLSAEGAAVVLNGRDADVLDAAVAEIIAAGGRASGVLGSLATPGIAYAMVDAAREDFGRLDAAINCAGVAEPSGSTILTIDSEEFAAQIDAHLTSAFEVARAAAEVFAAQGSGAIVLTGSAASLGIFGGSGYPAAKGGVNALALAIAAELRPSGVRVNVVMPGAKTRLSTGDDYRAHIDGLRDRGVLDPGMHAAAADPGSVDHVAAIYAYLVSDLAVDITGSVFSAAGNFIGRYAEPELSLIAYRDHVDTPPYTLDDIDAALAAVRNP
ncbi:Short-chain dehydrogenase [Williamsia maris]|uniref:Short-chain dehydrogenase n=2 Tax=Williamsia maris TaxID=72806 RepID=A0ABT1HIF8_9NOCA|nr:Short-chain dehydrogenase [Williamsia maris]